MGSKNIWIVSTKPKPLDGCLIELNGSDLYYVECLLPASRFDEAHASIAHLIRDKKMELIDVVKCEVYKAESWRHLVQFAEIKNAASHARLKKEPKFALFISSQAMDFNENDSDDDGVEWT